MKVAFDTPGSKMQNEIMAMISFDSTKNNVTLVLKSKSNLLIAKGK